MLFPMLCLLLCLFISIFELRNRRCEVSRLRVALEELCALNDKADRENKSLYSNMVKAEDAARAERGNAEMHHKRLMKVFRVAGLPICDLMADSFKEELSHPDNSGMARLVRVAMFGAEQDKKLHRQLAELGARLEKSEANASLKQELLELANAQLEQNQQMMTCLNQEIQALQKRLEKSEAEVKRTQLRAEVAIQKEKDEQATPLFSLEFTSLIHKRRTWAIRLHAAIAERRTEVEELKRQKNDLYNSLESFKKQIINLKEAKDRPYQAFRLVKLSKERSRLLLKKQAFKIPEERTPFDCETQTDKGSKTKKGKK